MVSTRQMATSGGQNGSEELPSIMPVRATVVTRQYSNNNNNNNNNMSSTSSIASCNMSNVIATRQQHNNNNKGNINNNVNQCGGQQTITTTNTEYTSTLHLHDLPLEILAKIFSYESYKRIGQLRLVSQRFNEVCMDTLNRTFSKLIAQTYNRFQTIKASMPRRESLRRNHPLACECDIIETCHMRLSLLQMTLGKHIERGHCCFFPGAILDELYTILGYIKDTPSLERPYRVTDELFDLSTMAMEYFRDSIEANLPSIGYFRKDFCRPALVVSAKLSESSSNSPSPPQSNMVLRKGIRKIKQGMKIYNNQLSVLRSELRTCKRKSTEQGKQICEQQKLLAEQQKQALEYANRMDENDKKNEEMARKFSTLLQELNKCKTELQYWRSKSPALSACSSCGQKMTTALAAEDFQALINQGVKPEHLILSLDEDNESLDNASSTDNDEYPNAAAEDENAAGAASVAATNESHHFMAVLGNEFAYPDAMTTAKLLNTNRQLKRQQSVINTSATTSQSKTSDILMANSCIEAKGNNSLASGFAPNLFYGNGEINHENKGVTVSSCSDSSNATAVLNQAGDVGGSGGGEVMPPETKKARRVQKTTRCLNTNGKRSK